MPLATPVWRARSSASLSRRCNCVMRVSTFSRPALRSALRASLRMRCASCAFCSTCSRCARAISKLSASAPWASSAARVFACACARRLRVSADRAMESATACETASRARIRLAGFASAGKLVVASVQRWRASSSSSVGSIHLAPGGGQPHRGLLFGLAQRPHLDAPLLHLVEHVRDLGERPRALLRLGRRRRAPAHGPRGSAPARAAQWIARARALRAAPPPPPAAAPRR